jgi:hypothetical protein
MNRPAAIALALLVTSAGCQSTDTPDSLDLSYRTYDRTEMSVTNTPTPTAPPKLDPTRKVAEQDCSKPVALDRGNLKCR